MTTGIDGGFSTPWQIVKPTGTADINLVTNPSFETNTTGWTQTNATLTRTAGAGRYGAYAGRLLASAANGKTSFACAAVASASSNAGSAHVRATSPLVQIKVTIGATSSVRFHPGDGLYHRVETPVTAPSSSAMVIEIIDTRTGGWDSVDIDGVQAETGTLVATTYIDGDQDGCSWTGTPHGSTSTRDGRDGGGGKLIEPSSVGLNITAWKGTGAPPTDVATLTLALADGEVYQRSTAKSRILTLVGLIIGDGAGLATWHAQRRSIIDLFTPDNRVNRGPITLRYSGAATPKLLQAAYQSGLEMDDLQAIIEKPEIKMMASDPVWKGETDAQASLTAKTDYTVSLLALHKSDGTWSDMATGSVFGSASTPLVQAMAQLPDGRIIVGGWFENMGGVTVADKYAVWNGSAWNTLDGLAGANNQVNAFAVLPTGEIFAGGAFGGIGGVTTAKVAYWNPASGIWAALSTGCSGGDVHALYYDPATDLLWVGGDFTSAGGVGSSAGVAYWNRSTLTWTGATTGGPGVNAITKGPDGAIYCARSDGLVRRWNGSAWVTIGTATGSVVGLTTANGLLYAYGTMSAIGGISVGRIAAWNGSAWQPLGTGATGDIIVAAAADPSGNLYVGGRFSSIGGITPDGALARWNGSTWSIADVTLPSTGAPTTDQVQSLLVAKDGSLVVSWTSSGTFGSTLTGEGITAVTNSGSSNAYPVVYALPGTFHTLRNLTTGKEIRMNPVLTSRYGTVTLDLRPGRKTFRDALGNDLVGQILSGSDMTTWALQPGSNRIGVYCTGSSPVVTMYWRPTYWSAD